MKKTIILFVSIIISCVLITTACNKSGESTQASGSSQNSNSSATKNDTDNDDQKSDNKTEKDTVDESSLDLSGCHTYSDAVEKGFIEDGTHRVTLEQIREIIDKYHDGKKVFDEVQKIQPLADGYDTSTNYGIASYQVDKDKNYRVRFTIDPSQTLWEIALIKSSEGNAIEVLYTDYNFDDNGVLISKPESE